MENKTKRGPTAALMITITFLLLLMPKEEVKCKN
jgi:hypothetical protein